MPAQNTTNHEISQKIGQEARLERENERLRDHIIQINEEWQEHVDDLHIEIGVLREENVQLKNHLQNNQDRDNLKLAMKEMEKGYEKQILVLQSALQRNIEELNQLRQQIKKYKSIDFNLDEYVDKKVIKEILLRVLDPRQSFQVRDKAFEVLCKIAGIEECKTVDKKEEESIETSCKSLENASLVDLWIMYLQDKTK